MVLDAQKMEILIDKILVIQTAFIGDAILTLPLLEKLKEKFPNSLIDIIAIPKTKEIFEASPFVNEVIILDKKEKHKSFFKLLKFGKQLKTNNYAKIFSPHRSFRTSLLVMMINPKYSVGFSTSSFSFIYKNVAEYRYDFHEVRRNLSLVDDKLNDDNWKIKPKLNLSSQVKNKVDFFLSQINAEKNFAAISPGSVWNTKKYPKEYFIEVCKYFYSKNFSVLLIGSEAEKKLCNEISEGFEKDVYNLCGNFSIIETIELLKHCKILITNDSSPTHFGMCADISVLTIYCSTVPEFGFYPYNSQSNYLNLNNLNCKPCGIHGYEDCPLNHFKCGKLLKPELVIKKIEEILNDN